MPLILAFYCIVGGDQPLPGRRADLYAKVIRRMLTGRWRGSGDRDPDPDACLETLRDWAWSAAASDPVSGVGAWADEFPTPRVRQSQDDRDALDHVAVPLGPPDPDTGMTQRRFVHRSLREHLVAEHIALRMPAEEAAEELLNHLWYDPDWEYAAPAALAMHPQRDQVLKELIGRVTGGRSAPRGSRGDRWLLGDPPVPGPGGAGVQRRRLVARGSRDDRAGQAGSRDVTTGNLRQVVACDWPTSNRLIIESLLALLADARPIPRGPELAMRSPGCGDGGGPGAGPGGAARPARPRDRAPGGPAAGGGGGPAGITAEDRAQVREALLALLARETEPGVPRSWRMRSPGWSDGAGPGAGPGGPARPARPRNRSLGARSWRTRSLGWR